MKRNIITLLFVSIAFFGLPKSIDAQNGGPFNMPPAMMSNLSTININHRFTSDTLLYIFNSQQPIYGLSVNMETVRDSSEFLMRLILEDSTGESYLIAESYTELSSNDTIVFNNYCEETGLLSGIVPAKLKLILRNAIANITNVNITNLAPLFSNGDMQAYRDSLRDEQILTKTTRINNYNVTHHKLWRASLTEISRMDYSKRIKVMGFPEDVSTGGMEYYSGGIFEYNNFRDSVPSVTNSSYVNHFDWRNVYGKNWLTPVKNQYAGPFCSSFAAVGCLEAMTNLYFNRLLNMDLSEYEVACCGVSSNGTRNPATSLMFIKNHGVVWEDDYGTYSSFESACRSDTLSAPTDIIQINDFQGYSSFFVNNMENIKNSIIQNGPQIIGLYAKNGDVGHAMVLVGYGEIYDGMPYYPRVYDGSGNADTIPHDSPYIGKSFLICKNSWGTYFGEEGYMNILVDTSSVNIDIYKISSPIYSMQYSDEDRVVVDNDNDGYYSWGIGSMPSTIPNWAPLYQDADDSNPFVGALFSSGYTENINPNETLVHYVDTQGETIHGQYVHYHNVIQDGGSLIIDQEMHFFNNSIITVESGGELVIQENGVLYDAILNLLPGGKVHIKEGGKIHMKKGYGFCAPEGVEVIIEHGSIE